ncbi:MAG: ribonuclease HI [Phycisphaerae bacterium]|nr:ribonuclease HI [Phycisphaerae bacterium]
MDDGPVFTLFTDGACSMNPGPGGWAYILRDSAGEERVEYGGEPSTTNNRMEMMAVIEGLRLLEPGSSVDVYSDSQYVVNGLAEWLDNWIARGWKTSQKKPVKNEELWRELDEFRKILTIRTHWIRGHDDHPENERCDRLAVQGRDEAAVHAGGS